MRFLVDPLMIFQFVYCTNLWRIYFGNRLLPLRHRKVSRNRNLHLQTYRTCEQQSDFVRKTKDFGTWKLQRGFTPHINPIGLTQTWKRMHSRMALDHRQNGLRKDHQIAVPFVEIVVCSGIFCADFLHRRNCPFDRRRSCWEGIDP